MLNIKKTQFNLIILLLTFGFSITYGQTGKKNIIHFGGYYSDKINHAFLDKNDNMIVGGMFDYQAWADDSLKSVFSDNIKDALIIKFSNDGKYLWGQSFGGKAEDKVLNITTDDQNNIYCAGSFQNVVTIDSDKHTGSGTFDNGIVVKYNTNGKYKWSKSFTGNNVTRVRKVFADKSGNIYAEIFTLSDSIKVGSKNIYGFGNNNNFYSIFIKLDTLGNEIWTKRIGSTGICSFRSFYVDENEEIVGIVNSGNADVEIGDSLISNSIQGIYFIRLNKEGNLLSYKFYPSPSSFGTGIKEIKIDKKGMYYLGGYFTDSITINNKVLRTTALHDQDFIVMKSDNQGKIIWAKSFGSTQPDYIDGLDIDNDNNIIVTGRYPKQLFIGNDTLKSPGTDGFVAKFDENGNIIKVRSTKSEKFYAEVYPMAVMASKNGSLWIAGDFNYQTFFDDSLLKIRSYNDGFLWRVKDFEATPTNIAEANKVTSKLLIYPNPAQSEVFISFSKVQQSELRLYSLDGRLVLSKQIQSNQNQIKLNISALKAGMYILNLQFTDGEIQNKVLVKP